MPFLATASAIVLLAALGFQQVFSDALARRAALPVSLVAMPPMRFAAQPWFTPTQRLLIAREAFADNDMPATRQALERLGAGSDRDALEGALAEREGDTRAATSAYLAAGDVTGLARIVTRMRDAGDMPGALALQEMIVRSVAGERTQPDALADALLCLGQLDDLFGRQHPAERAVYARRAMDAYERAVSLAPLSQTYLLNAGYEALYLGNLRRSEALFARARDADPKSADARVGLERAQAAARKARR